jgi:hypothetical protein
MNTEIDNNKAEADKKMWQTARWGVIIICVVHVFASLIVLGISGAEAGSAGRFAVLPILFNYWIASWYIQDRIAKGKAHENLMLMGIKVAGIIFIIQVVLGAILLIFAEQQIQNILNK